MRHLICRLIVSATLVSPVFSQNPQPQPQNLPTIAVPCNPSPQPQSPSDAAKVASHVHFNPFAVKGGIFTKGVKEITDRTGVSVSPPTPTETKKPTLPKPCPAAVPPPSAVSAPAAAKIPVHEPKTIFVCPPNTSMVPGYPFCLKPDNTLVDAIKITAPPDSKSNPPAPAATTAQH